MSLPVVRGTHTLHLSDTVSVERGRHFVKAGGEVRHYRSDGYNHVFPRGQLNFFGAFTGSGIADVLLGYPTVTLLATNDNPQALRTTAANVFVQDDWRVTTRLTLNAGLRYEFNKPPVDADDRMAIFDQTTATLRRVGQDGVPRAGIGADWNNVAPRVGASWLLRHDGSWLLRGGYGIYYDASTLIENSALYFNPPFFTFRVFVPGGPVLPTAADPFPEAAGFEPPISVNTLEPVFPTAHRHQGSLGIETRVRGVDVSARWVGASGTSLVRKRNLNQPPPGPGAVDERRPIPGYGDILLVETAGTSRSHACRYGWSAPGHAASGCAARIRGANPLTTGRRFWPARATTTRRSGAHGPISSADCRTTTSATAGWWRPSGKCPRWAARPSGATGRSARCCRCKAGGRSRRV